MFFLSCQPIKTEVKVLQGVEPFYGFSDILKYIIINLGISHNFTSFITKPVNYPEKFKQRLSKELEASHAWTRLWIAVPVTLSRREKNDKSSLSFILHQLMLNFIFLKKIRDPNACLRLSNPVSVNS